MKKTILNLFIGFAVMALVSCGSGIKGTYKVNGDGFFDQFKFYSGGKVEITRNGETKEGTYKKGDGKVTVIVGNENQVLTIDKNGCLDGGGRIGKYCK